MTDSFRIRIAPVPDGTPRPRWSVMIPTYNAGSYLEETLRSVLAQDHGPDAMQIAVVDDASTMGDARELTARVGGGRIDYYRQERNVGHVRNFNTCILRARGELIHILHGDDRVRTGFYDTMQEAFDADVDLGAAFCRHIYMDAAGRWLAVGPLLREEPGYLKDPAVLIGAQQPVQPPAMVVRRKVYEKLGGFDRRMRYCGEDWEMWVRIAASHRVFHEPAPLAEYRRHAVSLTARSLSTGENLRDLRRAVALYKTYLPERLADRIARAALERAALWGVEIAGTLLDLGARAAAAVQVREALRCNRGLAVQVAVAGLVEHGVRFRLRRQPRSPAGGEYSARGETARP